MSEPPAPERPRLSPRPADAPVLQRLDFDLFWNECDPAGIVYFASWFVWMERTQNEWMRAQGLGPDTIHERFGGGFVAANATADYVSTARAFDPIRCEMHLARIGQSSVTHAFLLRHRDTGADIAHGRLTLAWLVDGHASPLPEVVATRWT